MRLRNLLILIIILNSHFLYSFGGRPIRIDDVRPYYKFPDTAKVDIFVYTNTSGNTNFQYLTTTIPGLIANQIEYNKTVIVEESVSDLIPVNFESAYDRKVIKLSNITYTSSLDSDGKIIIKTNVEYKDYTNFGEPRTNVNIITLDSKDFKLETNEVIYNYNGEDVILLGTNNTVRHALLDDSLYIYLGDDMEEYIFNSDADIAIFGAVDFQRPNIVITSYIADIKSRKINAYKISIPESAIDDEIPNYSYEIANRISSSPKTGIVAINVNQEDAFVYLNNTFVGRTSTETMYIPAITTNKHRFTIMKDGYALIDKNIEFENINENVILNFNLMAKTGIGKVAINIPGGTNSQVIINGMEEVRSNFINKDLDYGTYALKIMNTNYKDYYGKFTLATTNTLAFTPSMIAIKPKTLAQEIFGNYERNTKIFLGLSIAASVFTLGTYIYANELFDATVVKHFNDNAGNPNPPPIDLRTHTTAMTIYWASFGVSAALALTTGIYYMLWIAEDDFPVESIAFHGGYGKASLEFSMKF